jgi:tetratricopeptide (TPR) repeat protein
MERDLAAKRLSPPHQLNLAHAYAAAGSFNEAFTLVERAYQADSSLTDGYARCAWQYYWPKHEYGILIEWMERDLAAKRLSPPHQLNLAHAYAATGSFNEAFALVERAYQADSSLIDGYARCAWQYYRARNDFHSLVAWLAKDLTANRLSPSHQLNLAHAYAANGSIDEAFALVERAYQADSSLTDGYARCAWQYYWPLKEYGTLLHWIEKDSSMQRLSLSWQNKGILALLRILQKATLPSNPKASSPKQIFIFGSFAENTSLIHSKRNYFERLASALDHAGTNLLVVDAAPIQSSMRLPTGGDHIHISIDPSSYIALFHQALRPDHIDIQSARIFADVCSNHHDPSTQKQYRLACFVLFECFARLLDDSRPDLVIYWNSFSPFHRWLRQACRSRNIPALAVESCGLPGMIEFDPSGSLGLSWCVRHNDDFNRLPIASLDNERIKTFLDTPTVLNMANKHRQTTTRSRLILRHPVIFVAGSALLGAGLTPRWHEDSLANSPFFADDMSLMEVLLPLAKKHKWTLLYKPHPGNESSASQFPQAVDAKDLNSSECIDQCDVMVTLVSSLSTLAMLRNKPCVLLGRNALWGKKCCYQPTSSLEVEDTVEQAIRQGLTPLMKTAWLDYATRAASWYAFSFTEEVESSFGRDVNTSVQFLLSYMAKPFDVPFPYPACNLKETFR